MKEGSIFTYLYHFIFLILTYFLNNSAAEKLPKFLIKEVNWCESPYCEIKMEHTICKYGPKCPPAEGCETSIDFNKDMKDYVMELHNEKRNKIALGAEVNVPQDKHKAANMKVIQWDIHLEFVARCHSRQCEREHDHCRAVPRFSAVGQNIYTKKLEGDETKNADVQDIVEQAIEDWYSEIENVPGDVYAKWNETEKPTADYTQMIWGSTGYVGCGLSQQKKEDFLEIFLVCNYGTKGNIKGNPIYTPGEPCTECSKGKECNSHFKGLCGNIEEYAMKCPCEEANEGA